MMNLPKQAICLFIAAFMMLVNGAVSADVISEPQTVLSIEPSRTASGIDYSIYIDDSDSLSTLFFKITFNTEKQGSMVLEENECFDVAHSEWNTTHGVSLKGYLGRTGNRIGFSSDEKIKVAKITIPIDSGVTGEVGANISETICAGVVDINSDAIKGSVAVPDANVMYTIKKCSILSSSGGINILSSENQNAEIILTEYDESGVLKNIYKESIGLLQGENKINIDFDESANVSVMVWDSIDSMCPLADKVTLFN